ncbi:hypothetical protein GCM10025787_12760 [Saccharopolyspora rosea]
MTAPQGTGIRAPPTGIGAKGADLCALDDRTPPVARTSRCPEGALRRVSTVDAEVVRSGHGDPGTSGGGAELRAAAAELVS